MQSFISEIENPLVQKDIIELGEKIEAFKTGKIDDDKFRALRLARGVYGQRQPGVQMIRIKLPFGKVTTNQLLRIADVSDEYSTGNLHITTRQDIQIHFVSLDRTPQLWAELEKDDVTLREACGNTVRNVTASALAGIDPEEVFDVSPYANLVYRYFLRKPFGQELGRKIKIAFSSNDKDDAFTFMHDIGFIAKVQNVNGVPVKGFKVLVGGGLGAQPFLAQTAYEFLPAEEILPFIEVTLRVFDRHGERNSRHKARIKYLIHAIGIEEFLNLIEIEKTALQYQHEEDFNLVEQATSYEPVSESPTLQQIIDKTEDATYKIWLSTNVVEQKQKGYFAAFLKVKLGNFSTTQARQLVEVVRKFAGDDIRLTIDQSILLKFIKSEHLFDLYKEIKKIGIADAGYNSVADVTACPGTDTCNLGISNSTHVAKVIEDLIQAEYPDLLFNDEIKIKISGCMNSCGQHGLAHIGFHGSSIKVGNNTAPALQVLIGGGVLGDGKGRIAEKVIKVPSKRVLDVIRYLLNDYEALQQVDETFHAYYDRQGKNYFYNLLKPLAETSTLKEEDFIDWGQELTFKPAIGVGECAGVMIDLISTLLFDADEKLDNAQQALAGNFYGDAIYHTYSAGIHTAKALLLKNEIRCNTHHGIINDFDTHLYENFRFNGFNSFKEFLLQINQNKPEKKFAEKYFGDVNEFVGQVKTSPPALSKGEGVGRG
jgi:sulfite reductase (ferredoxin)